MPVRAICRAVAIAAAMITIGAIAPAQAQLLLTDRPPVPPANVPNVPSGPAVSLAPPTGPSAAPDLPAQLTNPGAASIAPSVPSAPVVPPGHGGLALTARFGKDMPAVNGGVVWRVYADKPEQNGTFKLVKEDHSAAPNLVLPHGSYVVHASLGLVSAVRPVTVRGESVRESFELPAGGLRVEGRVGAARITPGLMSFDIYRGSQFETTERAPVLQAVSGNDIVLLPEGTYYIISNYGDANATVRSDIRVQAGKLTDVTVAHRAAAITLKLLGQKGGEALANTSWTVITPGGDVIKESTGAFPRVVLAEGEYRAIARNEGRVFEQNFKVVNGVDGEIAVLGN